MVAALYLVALLMVLAGAVSLTQGVLIFAFSTGATLVLAGAVAATGGVLLAGIAALLGTARRIADGLDLLGGPPPPDRDEAPARAEPPAPDVPPRPVPAPPDPPAEPPDGLRGTLPAAEPAVAGTYASGGNSYVMFTDGSVQADTPGGRFRFADVDELKAFIARGGERM